MIILFFPLIVPALYHKILKISPVAYIFQRPFWGTYFWRGLSTEGNLCFKIDWASLIVGIKFTVFALFHFVFEGNFQSTSHWGAYIWTGDLTEGFLRYRLGVLIFGRAYTWRGLQMYFQNFMVLNLPTRRCLYTVCYYFHCYYYYSQYHYYYCCCYFIIILLFFCFMSRLQYLHAVFCYGKMKYMHCESR